MNDEERRKKKYLIYLEQKITENENKKKISHCKHFIEFRNKSDNKNSPMFICPGLPHRKRWTVYSKDYEHIENYEKAKADNFKGWHCHHRLELHPDGSIRFTRESLVKLDLYINRPASELIFLTAKEHTKLHGANRWK